MRRLAPVLASGPVISQDAPMQGSARCASPGSANNATARAAHMPRTPRQPKLSFTVAMEPSPDLPARYAGDHQTRAIAVPKSLSKPRLQPFFWSSIWGRFRLTVTPLRGQAALAITCLRIIEETVATKPNKRTKAKAKPDVGDHGEKERTSKPAPTHGLPPYRLLPEDGRKVGTVQSLRWPEGFNADDGGSIDDFGEEGLLYKINYDNVYHMKYRRAARGGDLGRDVVTEKYILGMRIILMGYEHAVRALKAAKNGDGAALAEYHDAFRRMAARGAASTVLALAENLPKIVDRSTVMQAQEVE